MVCLANKMRFLQKYFDIFQLKSSTAMMRNPAIIETSRTKANKSDIFDFV